MRITTQMLNETSRRTGIPVNQTSLLDIINNEDSALDPLSGSKKKSNNIFGMASPVDRMQKDSYKKLEKSADSLKECAAKLGEVGADSLFQKAEKDQSTEALTSEIQKMVDAYNDTMEQLKKSGGAMNGFYKEELASLVDGNADALKAVGITKNKDGSLKVDSKTLKEADLDSLRKAVGDGSDFTQKVSYISSRVSANASAYAESLSSQYNASGSLYSGMPGTNHYNLWG